LPNPVNRAALAAPRADLLALLAGALLPLAFAPLSFFPLAVLSPALLFLLWLDVTPRRALWRGLLFGLGQFGVGVSWVYVAIHDFGYSGVPLAVLLSALFVGVLALFPMLLGYLSARLLRGPDGLRLAVLFPAGWTLIEWCRGWVFTGLPWLNLGYSQIDAPLRGFAPITGVYGVTLAVALSAGLLAALLVAGRRARFISLAGLALLWISGALLTRIDWTEASGPPLRVALVQGNIPQSTKWNPETVQRTLDLYADLTRRHWDSRLILWPEAAITVFYHDVADNYLAGLAGEARAHGTDIVLGIPVREPGTRRYFNSLLALSEPPAFYHKRHLVPFGDYLPLEDSLRGLIRFFDLPMSGFSSGPDQQPLLEAAGQKIASAICYEDIFGEELIDALPAATLLVNATNNAWYGNSFAPHQHLEMSRMRALETGRYMLRVTTNGVSAIIDPHGGILARSRQFKTQVLTGEAVPRSGATPYVVLGNWPVVSLLGLLLVLMTVRAGRGSLTPPWIKKPAL
jgi:apolipoprotein N-acyltransferase